MFIYVLNLLNEGFKKEKYVCERSASDVIKDTKYVVELAGIKRNYSFEEIREKIVNIFELLGTYNLTRNERKSILDKVMNYKQNLWLLEKINTNKIVRENSFELFLSSIINKTEVEESKTVKNESNIYFINFNLGAKIQEVKDNINFNGRGNLRSAYAY